VLHPVGNDDSHLHAELRAENQRLGLLLEPLEGSGAVELDVPGRVSEQGEDLVGGGGDDTFDGHDVAAHVRHAFTGPDVTYSPYLRIPELLALQQEPRAHDELLFVVIHQSHELWFKLVLHELDEVTRLIASDAFPEAETR